MSVPVVWVAPDLSVIRVLGPSGGASWRAPEFKAQGDEMVPGVGDWKKRAQDGAAWLAQQRGVKRRLGALIVDPADSVCLWVRSSSLAPPVLRASVGRLTEEWGDEASLWAVEPVYDTPRDAESGSDHALSAVCHHDALVRLLLDALDRRGIVPGSVLSGWHAMVPHADDKAGVCCVIVHEPEKQRLLWSWTDASGLLAGGSAGVGDLDSEEAEHTANAAMQRMAMDWMTWSSQLGTSPERGVILGPGAEALGFAWSRAFPDRAMGVMKHDDPIGHTLERVSKWVDENRPGAIAGTTRVCLGRISHRPTRKTRKRYQIAAVAALLSGVAIGSVAVWMRGNTEDWRSRAESMRADSRSLIEATWPGGIEGRPTDLIAEARSLYNQDLEDGSDVKLPPQPAPIFEEAKRVVEMLTVAASETKEDAPEDTPEDVLEDWRIRIMQFTMDDNTMRMALMTPLREVTTEISIRLNADDALGRWQLQQFATPNATRPTFQGNWIRN